MDECTIIKAWQARANVIDAYTKYNSSCVNTKGVDIMLKRKLVLFCNCILMLVMLFPGSMVMAKEQERAKPKVYQLQFVDPEGNPVPNLFVYWSQGPFSSDENDFPLPTRGVTNADGIWKIEVGEELEPGFSGYKKFEVKNLYGMGLQIADTYEINVNLNQTSPLKLVWKRTTPKNSLERVRHKMIIHVQDVYGKPIKNIRVYLYPYTTETRIIPEQGNFKVNGCTDRNGDFYTNLHDDIKYEASIGGNDLIIDATGGGTIKKTYVYKKDTE